MARSDLQNAVQSTRRYLVALCVAVSAALLPGFACAYSNPIGEELALRALPTEAQATIERIRQGGPFPYRKDGVTFGNREQRLPFRPRGYYREYTVDTPGARDRGARRVIAGREGEYYYSDDHYRSFHRVHIQERK